MTQRRKNLMLFLVLLAFAALWMRFSPAAQTPPQVPIVAPTPEDPPEASITELRHDATITIVNLLQVPFHEDEWNTTVKFDNKPGFRIIDVTYTPYQSQWHVVFDLQGNIQHVEPANTTARLQMGVE